MGTQAVGGKAVSVNSDPHERLAAQIVRDRLVSLRRLEIVNEFGMVSKPRHKFAFEPTFNCLYHLVAIQEILQVLRHGLVVNVFLRGPNPRNPKHFPRGWPEPALIHFLSFLGGADVQGIQNCSERVATGVDLLTVCCHDVESFNNAIDCCPWDRFFDLEEAE